MAAVTHKLLLLISLFAVALVAHAGKKEKPLTSVADLRYGVALYHYYQGDYKDALTELMVAKARGGIHGHGDNPALMEGGFALAYGLEKYAADVFSEVLAANVPEDAQVAAWYYLAKMRYLRGDWAMASSSIAEVDKIEKQDKKSVRDYKADINALRINLAIKQGDISQAEKLQKDQKLSDDWLPYILFNIGSLAARNGDFDIAINYYLKVANRPYEASELRALQDKALTAAGYAYLLNKQPEKAKKQFSRVRLGSPLSSRALLGYGWASANKEDYQESLKVWSHLSKATLVDENSQEAMMAVPYAYEKMGLDGIAVQEYQHAVVRFTDEIAQIDSVIANLEGDTFLEALKIQNGDGVDWLTYAETNQLAPQTSYLIELFSREEFQMAVAELRDLLGVQKNTQAWRDKLQFYSQMLDAREQDRESKTALIAENELKNKLQHLQQQRDKLALQIEDVASNKKYMALASGDEADLIKRAKRMKANLSIQAVRDDDPFIEDTDEAARRFYGILLWDASEKFSDRLWQAVKTLKSLDDTIEQLNKNLNSVETLLRSAPDLQPYRDRLNNASARLEDQSVNVDLAVQSAKDALRTQVVTVLTEQRNRIEHYEAQSRLSVARLYDKARLNNEAQAIQSTESAEGAQ